MKTEKRNPILSYLDLDEEDGWLSIYFEVTCFIMLKYKEKHPVLTSYVAKHGFNHLKHWAKKATDSICPKIQQDYPSIPLKIDELVKLYLEEYLEKEEEKFIPSAVAIIGIPFEKGEDTEYYKCLLLKRHSHDRTLPDKYCLPGGKLEPDETPFQGLLREIKEETGLIIKKGDVLEVMEGRPVFTDRFKIKPYSFLLKENLIEDKVKISEEHKSFLWVNPEELFDLHPQLGPATVEILERGDFDPIDLKIFD